MLTFLSIHKKRMLLKYWCWNIVDSYSTPLFPLSHPWTQNMKISQLFWHLTMFHHVVTINHKKLFHFQYSINSAGYKVHLDNLFLAWWLAGEHKQAKGEWIFGGRGSISSRFATIQKHVSGSLTNIATYHYESGLGFCCGILEVNKTLVESKQFLENLNWDFSFLPPPRESMIRFGESNSSIP